ncbi:MAG: RagB/SusD family nutrient uptake outer membrane protein [Williamsia sp.]|nr:RagB/SusD family nutrient uptake outer membrane protein [Williamsia sp.]
MKNSLIIGTLLIVFLGSCKKNLLDTAPYSQLATESMWSSDNLTDLGVNGIYSALRLGTQTGGESNLEIYQYDRLGYTGQYRNADALMNGTATPSNGIFSTNWQNLYEGIIRANDAIANIPLKSPSDATKKARLIAESKFLRAYFYFRLNQLWKGVPIYLEPAKYNEFTKARSTEQDVWSLVIQDLTACINEAALPGKYAKGSAGYGRATKGTAYALRGKVYMYTKEWVKAAADFAAVKNLGFSLFPNYVQLFKEANEQSDEMIFSIQNISVDGLGSTTQWYCGTRSSFGSCWNDFYVSPNLVDLYEKADGSKFNWDNYLPGYNSMSAVARQVYFLRDNLTAAEISAASARGADMTKYLAVGNEARIGAVYQNRDPRLAANVITPYSAYNGVLGSSNSIVISRFPYRTENAPAYDLRTDQQTFFYYLYRKFVYEGNSELLNRAYGPIDMPLIRYADVLLMWAEALNEQGDLPGAISKVNEVRTRAGMPSLQQSNPLAGTYVTGQADMTERIRNERRVEFPNEGIDYFDELRWKTLQSTVFKAGNGVQQVWGQNSITYTWGGDYLYAWPVPQSEREKNPGLTQNPGWPQ